MHPRSDGGFTLIELLVVIAIIAVLSVVVVLSLNPSELLRQSRDTNRLSDMDTLNHALSVYSVDQSGMPSFFMGSSSIVYVSLPDSSSTCGNLGLPILPTGYAYACVASTTLKNTNGSGWIPVPLSSTSGGSPVGNLPIDPTNQSSSRLYYTYTTNGTQYEITANMESQKYELGGQGDVISKDGGTLATVYEKGSKLGLEPLDYGDPSLVGLWTFDEGTGGTAYDYSGKNATGTWNGTGSHWGAGIIGGGAGQFASTTGDYITLGNNLPNTTGISGATFTAWIKPNTLSGEECIISKYTGGSSSWLFEPVGAGLSLYIITSGGMQSTHGGSLSTGTWQFVAGTYDGQNIRVFVNGAQVAATPQAGNIFAGSAVVQIGSYGSGSYIFPGLIDDIRVYSRTLSAAEIAAMYSGSK